MIEAQHESKTKILDAALKTIRAKGYTATRVEDICDAAGLTKGSFFHHFSSKEELAIAAAGYWGAKTSDLFDTAPYHDPADPLDRLLAYVDFRKALLKGALPEFTCFAGTTVQEVYETHPAIRDACGATIGGHAATLEADIQAAMRRYGVAGDPAGLALHIQAVVQGAFVLAKATQDVAVAADCLDHLRRYLELLFGEAKTTEATT
jgi:TetR/AcrR family transcriptional repressor of nem operon